VRISALVWNDKNSEHIADHGVQPWECEQVFRRNPQVRRTREDRYLALGATESGRHLLVVFRYLGNGVIRVITARDMTPRERRSHGKK
jgi:hypothetical protein